MNHRARAVGFLCTCLFYVAACGSSGGSGEAGPLNVNTLDGSTAVPVGSKFQYNASPPFVASTVTTSTYFIVPTPVSASASSKAVYDETICDADNAIEATMSSLLSWMYILTPAANLEYGTSYTACLTTDILYDNGRAFEGFMAQFATEESSPTTTVTATLSPADGATGVALDAAVTAVFSGAITDPSDWSAAFTLKKDDEGDSVCTEVTYDSSTLTATCAHADLDRESNYTSNVSGLASAEGRDIDAASADFTTKASVVISSTKLMRLDGTELDLTDQPIPRSARIKYTLATALSEESDRDAFEAAITVTDAAAAEVSGTYEWASDYLSVVFTPSSKFAYQTVYTITVNSSLLPVAGLSLSISSQTFTTMTYRDINGDGYADSVVGAQGVDGGLYNGAAYIFPGSANGISDCDLSGTCTSLDATIAGESNGDKLGYSVSTAGDVNADGYEDIIVGAKEVPNGGAAYVLLGSADGISDCTIGGTCASLDATITGAGLTDQLGYSVSAAGDVNGDGYDDVVIGAIWAAGGPGHGEAYVFLGSADGISDCDIADSCADATFTGEADGDEVGYSVFAAGDVNADGYDDVVVGAMGVSGGTANGAAYVFLGSADGISDCTIGGTCASLDATISGAAANDYLGWAVSAGDVNGDGYGDIMVGATGAGFGFGAAYVFLGSADGISDCDLSGACTADTTISGEAAGDYLGYAVSTAGDVNGDGYADFIVGNNHPGKGDNSERAYLFMGSASGVSDCDLSDACTADATFTGASGELGTDDFSKSLSAIGDINGDGYADIAIGAFGVDTYKGSAYLFLGSADGFSDCDLSGACTADTTIVGAAEGDRVGSVQAGATVPEV